MIGECLDGALDTGYISALAALAGSGLFESETGSAISETRFTFRKVRTLGGKRRLDSLNDESEPGRLIE